MVQFLQKYGSFYWIGIKYTLILSVLSLFFGFFLGTLLALTRLSKHKVLSYLATAYIEFFRGTPLMVQLYMVYFGSFIVFGLDMNRFISGLVAVSLNSAAYVAEIIRSGINSVDKGQKEAGLSLGLKESQVMRHIILPQAFKNVLPALGNELVTLIKETSIASTIGVTELMYNADKVNVASYDFRALVVAAGIYFLITFTMSKSLGGLERRLAGND
ncbi:putative arginine ABC transporter, permease protein ArtQ [Peptostreptococcaceae bacterium oral taxon 113 str. W5053]|nr:putative arginine ABC transporter, permease protein ArtQ [Peptostreptococcaceae bacterium oral taxon 113 str. W5053]